MENGPKIVNNKILKYSEWTVGNGLNFSNSNNIMNQFDSQSNEQFRPIKSTSTNIEENSNNINPINADNNMVLMN